MKHLASKFGFLSAISRQNHLKFGHRFVQRNVLFGQLLIISSPNWNEGKICNCGSFKPTKMGLANRKFANCKERVGIRICHIAEGPQF
jgi:hypothetical protein